MSARSLVGRLAWLQQALAAAIILVFAGSAIWLSSRALLRQETAFLSNTATQLADGLAREWREESDLRRAAASALEEDAPPGVRVDILDGEGRRVASTVRGPAGTAGEMHAMRVHLARGATVVVSVSTQPRHDATAALVMALLLAAIPLFITVTLVSRGIARRALAPLSRMAAQAERATAQGAVAPLGRPEDPDEIATLSASFNRLFDRLDASLRAERHFTQDAAHELKTPLTVLSGEVEYALSAPWLPERHREGLQRAFGQAQRMSELVEALLLLRRADPGAEEGRSNFVPVNLADVARELRQEFAARSPDREGDLTVEARDEVLVAGQPVLLASALRNLISNALKFTEPGQAVRVSVDTDESDARVIVEDAGDGIAPAERERVFDAFYRSPEARADREGSGLGLPILRRVARAHGGDVLATSSALGGARFELRLPAWSPQD